MPFHDAGGLRYLTFEALSAAGVPHAVFTRRGGVSGGPYAELNVGATVGDEIAHVRTNLERAFAALNRRRESMFDSWLVHGNYVLVASSPRPADWVRPPRADIILTDKPEVTLFMRYADCVPLVLYDPAKRAIGLAHAGWRGTVAQVAATAVAAMSLHFGSRPADVLAAIGPSISAAHYEVGEEVAAQVQRVFGAEADALLPRSEGRLHFDLVAANRLNLQQAGVRHIEAANLCTFSNQQDWFSHRGSGGRTGRFGSLIALPA
jgi:YfiH family protein